MLSFTRSTLRQEVPVASLKAAAIKISVTPAVDGEFLFLVESVEVPVLSLPLNGPQRPPFRLTNGKRVKIEYPEASVVEKG